MEPLASVVDKLKGFAKSAEEFVKCVIDGSSSRRKNPIEILKRLQREAFSDLMKLRDRQDKIERMLSFYKSSKGSPFLEQSTHMKGEVNLVGALFPMRNADEQTHETLSKAGIRTGTDLRFIFETIVRQKDALVAEFVASQNSQVYRSDVLGSPLSLTKVMYLANISDEFSMIAIPVGGQCKDVGIGSNALQGRGLTEFSSFGPPLFSECHDYAAGLMVKGSNIAASLAEFVSGFGIRHCFSTFGQIVYQPSLGPKFTLSGLHQMNKSASQQMRPSTFTIPIGIESLRNRWGSEASVGTSPFSATRTTADNISAGSIALMLESEFDESTRVGGWVEMQKSSPRYMKWAISVSDTPDDELGWGVSMGGTIQSPSNLVHYQMEAFLKFYLGKRFIVQPGLVYLMDRSRVPLLMFRSSWSL